MTMLRARETFFAGDTKVSHGQLVASTDPIARGRAHLFDVVPSEAPVVEQATAAPGERRNTRRG